MDQAIEILAKKGSAKLIEFGPLRSTDVTLPSGAKFVIANRFGQQLNLSAFSRCLRRKRSARHLKVSLFVFGSKVRGEVVGRVN